MSLFPATDLSRSLRDWTGHSGLVDGVIRFAAEDLIYVVVLIVLAIYVHGNGLRAAATAAVGALGAVGAAALLGQLVPELRPFVAYHFAPLFAHNADPSFPSDHLAVFGAVTAAAWYASPPLGEVATVLSVWVGLARVAAGVHYLRDVLAGFAIGVALAVLVWWVLGRALTLLDRFDSFLMGHRLRIVLWGDQSGIPPG